MFDRLLGVLVAEPALVELCALALVGAAFAVWFVRLARAVDETRALGTTADLLIGSESLAQGNARDAVSRLARVVAAEPEDIAARAYYADALAAVGDYGEAHKQRIQLARAFGFDTAGNRIELAATALCAGRPVEALQFAQSATVIAPLLAEGWRLMQRAALQLGRHELAGDAAERLLALPVGTLDEAERAAVRARGARALARAVSELCAASSTEDPARVATAHHLWTRARSLDATDKTVWRAGLQLRFCEAGDAALREELDRLGDSDGWRGSAEASFVCSTCAGPLEDREPVCPHCHKTDSARNVEPAWTIDLDAPEHVLDAIEENPAHVLRLLDRWLEGADSRAREQLLSIGSSIVDPTLQRAIDAGESSDTWQRAVALLSDSGVGVVGKLLTSFAGVDPPRRSTASAAIGAVVRGLGPAGLASVETLPALQTDPDLRNMLIDCYANLADREAFVVLLDAYAPIDVVRRVERLPTRTLRTLAVVLSRDPRSMATLFGDPTFSRHEVLWDAIRDSDAVTATIESTLALRGYDANLARRMIEDLADAPRAPVAGRLLDGYGEPGLRAQVAAFADPLQDAAVRGAIRRRLLDHGSAVIGSLIECFAAAPGPLDPELLDLLIEIGDAGTTALSEAYVDESKRESGDAAPGSSRSIQRRRRIVEVLAAIASDAARARLVELRERTTRSDLRDAIDHALGSPPQSAERDGGPR